MDAGNATRGGLDLESVGPVPLPPAVPLPVARAMRWLRGLRAAVRPSRRLDTERDRWELAGAHNRAAGAAVYTARDFDGMDVHGFFRDGELVAGYAINTRPPFFYIERIPPEERTAPPLTEQPSARFAEIRALWIRRDVPDLLRARVYCRSVLDAAAERPDYVLGGTVVPGARRTLRRAVPHLLWEGPDASWGPEVLHATYFYGRPLECVARLPYSTLGGWLDRVRRGR